MPEQNQRTRRRATKAALLALSGTAIWLSVRYIANSFAWGSAIARLTHMDLLEFFGGGSAAILAFVFLRTLRWRMLLGNAVHGVPFSRLYLVNVVSVAAANFTPAQAGEVMKVELLKRISGVQRWDGATSFVLERVADLIAVLIFAAAGLAAYPGALPRFNSTNALLALVVVLIGSIAAGVIGRRLFPRLPSPPSLGVLLRLVAYTVGIWGCIAVGWWISAKSVGVRLGVFETFGLVGIATLGGVLSLLPGGLGVTEALISAVLQRTGHSAPDAQAVALVVRAFSLLWIPIGLLHLAVGVALIARGRRRAGLEAQSAGAEEARLASKLVPPSA